MAHIIEITDITVPELDVFARLTESQLRNRLEPEKGIFIGGGANLYKQVIDIVDIMYITEIDAEYQGDTYFPDFDENNFTKETVGHFESTVSY